MSHQEQSSTSESPTPPQSLFTLLTRATYVPPSPPTPSRKSSKDARSGASVAPDVLEALIIKQPPDVTGDATVVSNDWLNLTEIAQDPVYLTPVGAFDEFVKPVNA